MPLRRRVFQQYETLKNRFFVSLFHTALGDGSASNICNLELYGQKPLRKIKECFQIVKILFLNGFGQIEAYLIVLKA